MPGLLEEILKQVQSAKRDAVPGVPTSAPTPGNDPYQNLLSRLDSYIANCWEAARSAKESQIEPDMLEDLRQREGVYSPAKLAEIRKQGGSEVYMLLTNVKCRAAEGWIRDILLPAGERPFTVKPTPVPDDLPQELKAGIYQRTMTELEQAIQAGLFVTPEAVYERARSLYDQIQQRMRDEAKIRAQRMEDAIDDVLVEGAWYDAMEDMIPDLVALPAGILKGPVIRKNRRLTWVPDPKTGKSVPQAEDELVPMFYSPSVLDIYPAPDSRDIDDGYLFERIPLRRSALFSMIGVPGYDEQKIRAALEEYQRSGYDLAIGGDQQRRELERSRNWQMSPDGTIDALEFHGSVRGEWLLEWGMEAAQVPDADADYEVTCLKVGRFIVRCVLNEDPLRRRPYMKASFDSIKGQFWGRGLPRLIRDLQNICNACARALCNNMGIASGPMLEVEVDRLASGEDVTQIYPWRIFQTKSSKTTPSPAVRFHNPQSVVDVLMKVYGYFAQLADNYSGIPSYEQGVNPTTGAAGTASGLSMLMTASSRQIKRVIAAIDRVIEDSLNRVHTHIMLFDPNPDVKGDAQLQARGAASLVAKEQQQLRRTQFLQATANAIDAPILGPMGRAALLRETIKALDLNPDDILPSKDEMLAQQRQATMMLGAPGQQPGQPGAVDAAGNPAGGVDHALFSEAA